MQGLARVELVFGRHGNDVNLKGIVDLSAEQYGVSPHGLPSSDLCMSEPGMLKITDHLKQNCSKNVKWPLQLWLGACVLVMLRPAWPKREYSIQY